MTSKPGLDELEQLVREHPAHLSPVFMDCDRALGAFAQAARTSYDPDPTPVYRAVLALALKVAEFSHAADTPHEKA